MSAGPLLQRVMLKNDKSIEACNVELGPLAFLVGLNGSGKSNFIDALRFVADSLRATLDHALRDRGGINEVRRRGGGHPTHFVPGVLLARDGGPPRVLLVGIEEPEAARHPAAVRVLLDALRQESFLWMPRAGRCSAIIFTLQGACCGWTSGILTRIGSGNEPSNSSSLAEKSG